MIHRLWPCLLLLVLAACAPGQMLGPTLTPAPTETPTSPPTPTPTNTPTATDTPEPPTETPTPEPPTETPTPETIGMIETSQGKIAILSVKIGDRFPPDCGPIDNVMCQAVVEGYEVLTVYLSAVEGYEDLGDVVLDIFPQTYVIAGDGTQTNGFSGGMAGGDLFVGFTPPESNEDYTLYWPGSDPVPLGQ